MAHVSHIKRGKKRHISALQTTVETHCLYRKDNDRVER